MAGIGTNLHRAVFQNYIGIRNAVILIDPLSVQSNLLAVELIRIIIIFLGKGIVIIPAVKNSIQPLRLRQFLQGMALDVQAFLVFQLVGQHIVVDGTTGFLDQGADIQCAKAVIPIPAQVAQVIAGSVQNFRHLVESRVTIVLHMQRNGTGHNGAG